MAKSDKLNLKMSEDNIQSNNNIPELQSPFEQLREIAADGKVWWNSRKLELMMGYGKYCLKTTNILDTFE
ncbi:MAG: hypothetical protein J6J37_08830 [Bacteroidaceae bacterium]|nr:hypothetical protein [Bacteroidaceae bacterium]